MCAAPRRISHKLNDKRQIASSTLVPAIQTNGSAGHTEKTIERSVTNRFIVLVFLCAQIPILASGHPGAEQRFQAVTEIVHTEHGGSLAIALIDEIDVGRTSRFVLGRHAREATPEEIAAFE